MTDAILIAGGVVYANKEGNSACPPTIELMSSHLSTKNNPCSGLGFRVLGLGFRV